MINQWVFGPILKNYHKCEMLKDRESSDDSIAESQLQNFSPKNITDVLGRNSSFGRSKAAMASMFKQRSIGEMTLGGVKPPSPYHPCVVYALPNGQNQWHIIFRRVSERGSPIYTAISCQQANGWWLGSSCLFDGLLVQKVIFPFFLLCGSKLNKNPMP